VPPDALGMAGYEMCASPTLYSGQTIRAAVTADPSNPRPVTCRLYLRVYDKNDNASVVYGPEAGPSPGATHVFKWRAPDTDGYPIASVGVQVSSDSRADGTVYLDYLTWEGTPDATFKPAEGSTAMRAWANGVDHFAGCVPGEGIRLLQDEGTGLLIQGCREWTDYRVTADVTPHMAAAAGLAARVQGMRRYYALLLCSGGAIRLVKALDGAEVLAEKRIEWEPDHRYELGLTVTGNRLEATLDSQPLFDVHDTDRPLCEGAIALVCEEGRSATSSVRVRPTT
jgi:hypothetical protein